MCLQYIEEPVRDTRDLEAFSSCSDIGIALDETLDDVLQEGTDLREGISKLQALMSKCKIAAVIIKPSLLPHGPSSAIKIAKRLSEPTDVSFSANPLKMKVMLLRRFVDRVEKQTTSRS